MTLEQAVNHAAQHLPENWMIRIEVMEGFGGVTVERPDLSEVDMNDGELDLVEQVLEGVRLAHDEIAADKLSEENAGAMARGLAAQDSDNTTEIDG